METPWNGPWHDGCNVNTKIEETQLNPAGAWTSVKLSFSVETLHPLAKGAVDMDQIPSTSTGPAAGEKLTPVMIYTLNTMVWGDLYTREAIKVSVWLRTAMAPQYITLRQAQVITLGGAGPIKPYSYAELHIPTPQVFAFHIKPPDREPLDYDPDEPNRKMEPITALVGSFRFDGTLRMSNQTNLERYLDVTSERYTMIYEVAISQPAIPAMGVIRVPMALAKRDVVAFAHRVVA